MLTPLVWPPLPQSALETEGAPYGVQLPYFGTGSLVARLAHLVLTRYCVPGPPMQVTATA